jgi:hypothetical protein
LDGSTNLYDEMGRRLVLASSYNKVPQTIPIEQKTEELQKSAKILGEINLNLKLKKRLSDSDNLLMQTGTYNPKQFKGKDG